MFFKDYIKKIYKKFSDLYLYSRVQKKVTAPFTFNTFNDMINII